MDISLVLFLSILIQLVTAVFSLFLVRLTGFRLSWILMAIVFFLMDVRRIIPLYSLLNLPEKDALVLGDVVALVLSGCMLFGVIGISAIFRERLEAEKTVKKLLEENNFLLHEVHHRIKNNMSTVAALLGMQSAALADPEAARMLEDAESRVQSMMVLYDKLYRSENMQEISLDEYLHSLVEEVISIFSGNITVKTEMAVCDITLAPKILSPLGIIINELITNSMKYAFSGRDDALIRITATKNGNTLHLEYLDNGGLLPESVSFANPTGFGLQLVKGLVEQLRGSIRIERNQGTKFVIEIKV
jgi:two-component sensor histidine kinase